MWLRAETRPSVKLDFSAFAYLSISCLHLFLCYSNRQFSGDVLALSQGTFMIPQMSLTFVKASDELSFNHKLKFW